MHAVYSLFMGHRQSGFQMTDDRRTLLGRKPTPQNTHLHEGRMLRHDLSMVSHASDSHDERTSPTNLRYGDYSQRNFNILRQIMETLEREREESRNREDRLTRQIEDLRGKLKDLTTLVEKQEN